MSAHPAGPQKRAYLRIECGAPCGVFFQGVRLPGTVWNVSVLGAYVTLSEPLPPVDGEVLLIFSLPGESTAIACVGRIRWRNEQSGVKRSGGIPPRLPSGCGIEFVYVDAMDRDRIADRVCSTL